MLCAHVSLKSPIIIIYDTMSPTKRRTNILEIFIKIDYFFFLIKKTSKG